MPNKISSAVFILASVILTFVNSRDIVKEYVLDRDVVSGLKAPEYTVHDTSNGPVQYRLESRFGLSHNLKMIKKPSNEEVGRLKGKITLFYKANISILNPKTNEWNHGSIVMNYQLMGNSFEINWHDGHRINVETKESSSVTDFYGENQQLLAQAQRRGRFAYKKRFILKIFSGKYPEQIYIFGLAAHDAHSFPPM